MVVNRSTSSGESGAPRAITVEETQTPDGKVFEVDGPITAELPAGMPLRARRLLIRTHSVDPCPEWVNLLPDLTDLQITYQGHRELPTVRLRGPVGLRGLTVRGAGIRGIKIEISALRNLRKLDLGRTLIRVPPVDVAMLSGLEELILDYPVTKLPNWIGKLTALRRLVLGGTLIGELPDTLAGLTAIEDLDVSRTKLTELPAVVGSLRTLRRLIAHDAPIASVAPEVGDLENLRYLDLDGCPLRRLPPELGRLPESIELRLTGTQLNEPLPALVSRGIPALLSYLRSLEADSSPQYEAKVLLLGEGNVGKSSLVAALCGRPFKKGLPTTHGIELNKLDLPHPTLDQRLRLTTWDFGGQEIYRVTHQFFYSPRSLYLLVWRPREGQDENAVEAWIRRVKLRIGDAGKIILVATYGAEGRSPELDFPYLKQKFGETLLESLSVDNETNFGIDRLRQVIANHAATLPQMGELFSGAWIAVRDEIVANAAEHAYITWHELAEICGRHGLDPIERSTLITLLHDLGHLIHFGEDAGLRDLVVLRPEWLTKAISFVLEDSVTRDSGGVLRYERLSEIWNDRSGSGNSRDSYDADKHPYFLRLMEKFDVSYRLPEQRASLVGQLVPYQRPDLPWYSDAAPGIRTLSLLCRMSESPPGLIAWLTVRNHRFWTDRHWRRGVFLAYREHAAQALFELVGDRDLRLVVRAPSPDLFFSLLSDSVEYLINQRWPGLRHELLVPCPQRLAGTACTGTFSFASLRRFRELGRTHIDCHVCAQQQEVARLLTGFELVTTPFDTKLDQIVRHLEEVQANQQHAAIAAAETAAHVRGAIKVLNAEITDCPRLFTVERLGSRRRLPWNDRFQLTLCCEHPGHEHPWEPATYVFTRPKSWFREVLPYATFVGRLLKVAMPVAGSVVRGAPRPERAMVRAPVQDRSSRG
jgi:internalin A